MSSAGWLRFGHHIDEWGTAVAVGMPVADLNGHMVILGTTNSGKSTLLRNLVLQYFGLGGTVVLLEPHGDLVLDRTDGLLAALAPVQMGAVTLIDLDQGANGWPTAFNLVSAGLAAGREVAVSQTMQSIHAMEDANWQMAVRMREILENSLHLLLDVQGETASLVALHRFLVDGGFRQEIMEAASPSVQLMNDWWERHLEQWRDPKRRESLADILEPAERRVLGFLRNQQLRRGVALPSLAAEQALNLERRLNRPHPHLMLLLLRNPATKRLYGTLFMQQLAALFQRRGRLPRAERRPLLVIIDEFPDLAGSELGSIVSMLLAQARKFGAALCLSAQSLMQLPQAVQVEVKNNTSSKIILRTAGEEDAAIGVANLGSAALRPSHLMNVEPFHGYARTTVGGAVQPPFYLRTLPAVRFQPDLSQFRAPETLPPSGTESEALSQAGLRLAYRQLTAAGAEALLADLVRLDGESFQALVTAQVAASRAAAQRLLTDESLEPDPVQRVRLISRAQHGLPWWLYEAHYRRLRLGR